MKYFLGLILFMTCQSNAQVISYNLNGLTTGVKQDTTTPANSRPLPTSYLDSTGSRVDLATEQTLGDVNNSVLGVDITLNDVISPALDSINAKTPLLGQAAMASSSPVVIASNQTAIPVSPVVYEGTFAQITNLVATAQTFIAPPNSVGFKIQAPSTNTENIAFSIGATATITAGILMEPGRSEDFDVGSNISVIATSATQQRVTVIWKVKP